MFLGEAAAVDAGFSVCDRQGSHRLCSGTQGRATPHLELCVPTAGEGLPDLCLQGADSPDFRHFLLPPAPSLSHAVPRQPVTSGQGSAVRTHPRRSQLRGVTRPGRPDDAPASRPGACRPGHRAAPGPAAGVSGSPCCRPRCRAPRGQAEESRARAECSCPHAAVECAWEEGVPTRLLPAGPDAG